MDNKWIVQKASELLMKMDNFAEDTEQYPDMERQIDWDLFSSLQSQIKSAIKNVDR